ncbi:iron uptake protein [Ideonella sp. TBM-1]|uniref:Iron uptake protein n=1 Tax=Ideonella livida TaxID=2707176 RepID=A0A7C9TH21_9BURK|nr:iron uptake protein [Ideonella livida]
MLRCVCAVLGGWALCWGGVAAGTATLVAAGMDFHDAETILQLLALVGWLSLFLWAFACASARRVAVVLLGGAALLQALGWGLPALLPFPH